MSLRVTLLVLLLGALAAAWAAGWHERFDAQALGALLRESGPWGPLLFVLSFSLLEAAGVPGVIFILTAAAVWPAGQAFALSWLGGIGAGVVGFGFARTLGREWVAAHLPERMRELERRVAERGLQTVIVARLLFFMAPPAHWALGLSPVRVSAFVLGTAIGLLPGVALMTFAGATALDWLSAQPRGLWIGLAIAGLALALLRRWRKGTLLTFAFLSPPLAAPPVC